MIRPKLATNSILDRGKTGRTHWREYSLVFTFNERKGSSMNRRVSFFVALVCMLSIASPSWSQESTRENGGRSREHSMDGVWLFSK